MRASTAAMSAPASSIRATHGGLLDAAARHIGVDGMTGREITGTINDHIRYDRGRGARWRFDPVDCGGPWSPPVRGRGFARWSVALVGAEREMLAALLWMNSCWRGRLGLDSPARSTRSPAQRPDADP